jgi:hypothetical protein
MVSMVKNSHGKLSSSSIIVQQKYNRYREGGKYQLLHKNTQSKQLLDQMPEKIRNKNH